MHKLRINNNKFKSSAITDDWCIAILFIGLIYVCIHTNSDLLASLPA